MSTLENILSDEPIAEEPVIEEVREEPSQPRDEAGRFAPKGEQESASPAPVEEPQLDHPALLAERRRRQEAEARAKELEEKLNPPAPIPSVFEDEVGFQEQFGSQVVTQAVSQATLNARLDMSEMLVRQANPDFEEVKAEFLKLAEENPTLRQQALSDPHPWNKAYQIAKNHRAMQELGATDVTALEAKLREKIMAELKASTPAVPESLADAQSTRGTTAPFAPPSLNDILFKK